MDDPEFAARLYQLGKTVGQELRVRFEEQHNPTAGCRRRPATPCTPGRRRS